MPGKAMPKKAMPKKGKGNYRYRAPKAINFDRKAFDLITSTTGMLAQGVENLLGELDMLTDFDPTPAELKKWKDGKTALRKLLKKYYGISSWL